jgi:hypothetical protein
MSKQQPESTTKQLEYWMVCSRSPRGGFRRAGIDFARTWRVIAVGDSTDIEAEPFPIVGPVDFLRIKAECAETLLEWAECMAAIAKVVDPRPEQPKLIIDNALAVMKRDAMFPHRPPEAVFAGSMLVMRPADPDEVRKAERAAEDARAKADPSLELELLKKRFTELEAKQFRSEILDKPSATPSRK